MALPIYQVDAFTDKPYAGNPAAVVLLEHMPDDAWMQAVAREMNLSETAFLLPQEDGYRLRWFTPAVEVDLCGHATLASAHVLWETQRLTPVTPARFHTHSGLLIARRENEWIELDFPRSTVTPVDPPEGLAAALGVEPRFVGRTRFDLLVEVASESAVRDARPDFAALRKMEVRGIMVTSRAQGGAYDFVSRFFAPGAGIDEDPVTGSAHCALAPFWSERLGKKAFLAQQVSRRGGVLRVKLAGDRVLLNGQAVTVLRGELL